MRVLTNSATPRHNEQVVQRDLADGEGVLLHLESGEYHGVNDVGSTIWKLIDGQRSVADLVAALRDQVEDPPRELEAEVTAFLEELRVRNLILL